MAETLTDKLKLSKRDTGDLNWGQGANANLDAIDAHAQQAILRPPRTLLATLGSGAVGPNLLGSTTYFYKVTAVNAAGETTEGKIPAVVEAQVTQPATPLPVILQWETVKGATGYKVYKATASGQEKFLASVSGEATSTYTDDGNTAVNGAIPVPSVNTARTAVSKIIAGSNVTVSPPDGTGDVTINAAGGTVSDASDTVKGVAKLSIAPAVPSNPVAVGDNDPRNSNARAPTGAAGGDLSGTYPSPSVAKVNGTSVPASPSAGQVLTATGPTAAAWQTPAGGGGYATVVAPAATGVEATDTANLQAALDAVDTLKGGEVVLREGTYLCGQLIIRRHGLKLRGLNGNMIGNSLSAGGSKIRFNVSTQDGFLVQADHVTIEGVGFQMTNVSGGFACIRAGANFISGGRSLVIKNCSFVEIRQSSVGLRVSGLERLVVDQCMFEFNNPFGNSVSYTAIGVKVEGGVVPTLNGVISDCVFWDKNANPPTGGAVITVKFIVLDGGGERYKISGCHGRGFAGGSAAEPSTFIEVRDVGNWVCSDNRFDQLNRFIKDISTGIPGNVTVTGNVCYQSSAPSPEGLIDLVAARSWSIVGNVISSGVKSVRLQIGTALVIVLGNALGSPVDNTGSGNVVVNNT